MLPETSIVYTKQHLIILISHTEHLKEAAIKKWEGKKEVGWRGREGKKQGKEAGGHSRRAQSRLHPCSTPGPPLLGSLLTLRGIQGS